MPLRCDIRIDSDSYIDVFLISNLTMYSEILNRCDFPHQKICARILKHVVCGIEPPVDI